MTTDQTNRSLTSILPMSCRNHAEDFARRLHCKLSSLGGQPVGQNSWLATNHNGAEDGCAENSVNLQQTKHTEANSYFNFGVLNSPGSPEELSNENLENLINNTKCLSEQEERIPNGSSGSIESDSSDGTFYDTRNEFYENVALNQNECTNETVADNDSSGCFQLSNSIISNNSTPPNVQQEETYTSRLNIDNELTIECPKVLISQASIVQQNSFYDNDDEEQIPRVRRCSSLKTGKTPPGTPSSKKIVRFADVLGLDLADVRTFLDEIPKVPTSAYDDLRNVDVLESDFSLQSRNLSHGVKVDKILMPLFQQPGGEPWFMKRVREQNVCLENAMIEDPLALAIIGTVRVRNLDFHKSVHIRYTLDAWQTFADLQATYLENSCDGFSDKFTFLMYAHSLAIGHKLQFAVRFQCKGVQYWDNNKGVNYCFQCLPATSSTISPDISASVGTDESWGASFYY